MAKKNYQDWDKQGLIQEILRLKKRKKYGLVWEDKQEDVATQCQRELPVLQEVNELAITTATDKPTNLLIEGDNYHALSVLNYTHQNKIDVIYIDPPYNTGAKDWKYNNDYVDKQDGYRHSKWLSMMAKRLRLAKNLLTDSGFICCAIDHNELFTLGCLMDAVFGENNRCGVVTVVHNAKGRSDAQFVSVINEYTLIYAKNQEVAKMHNFELSDEKTAAFNREDKIGKYRLQALLRTSSNSNRNDRPKMYFSIYYNKQTEIFSLENSGDSIEILPIDPAGNEKCWRWGKDRVQKKFCELFCQVTNGRNVIYTKSRIEDHPGEKARSVWINPKYSNSTSGIHLRVLIGRDKFNYPKSVYAVLDFLKITSKKDSIILDFFAGSGTTGHAVSLLNKEDDGNRQFILCTNNENGIAREVCHPRIKAVIEGHPKLPDITGIPSNLKYYQTDFVPAATTDQNKIKLALRATEMLCVRENTFEEVEVHKQYKIFRDQKRYTGIIYDADAIDDFKQAVRKRNGKFSVYVFSFCDDDFAPEFADLNNITAKPIPQVILRIYKRLFN